MNQSLIVLLVAILFFLQPSVVESNPVSDPLNPHNLSFGATHNRTKADDASERGAKEICVFCHTPHSASAQGPLWNRQDPSGTFDLYNSASLKIKDIPEAKYTKDDPAVEYPNGASKLCLSCHDGVTGVGTLLARTITMNNETMPADFVIDLTQTHPVSFVYSETVKNSINSAGKTGYTLPTLVNVALLDSQSRVQCTTCHDPHDDRSEYAASGVPPFWRHIAAAPADSYDAVCGACHPGDELSSWTIGSGNHHTDTFPR